jgi:cytochrome P450
VARAACTKGLRRKLLAFPRILATLVGSGVVLFAVLVVALRSALFFRCLAAVFLLAVVAEAWRSRPSYGRGRRLPPGSLALAPAGPWVDPDFLAKQARRHGPVFKMSNFTQPMVAIVDMELGRELLRRHDGSLAVPPLPFQRFVPGGFVRYLGPGPHRVRSAELRTAFSDDVVAAAEPCLAGLVSDGLAELVVREEAPPSVALERTVLRGFAHLFFGLDPRSERCDGLLRQMRTIDYRRAWRNPASSVRRAVTAASSLILAEPAAGFLGKVAAAQLGVAVKPEVLVNLLYVFNTASADVAGLMGWILKRLADNPDWLERTRATHDPSAAAERIVRETLRLSQSEYLARYATADLDIGDYVIPKGYLVRVCIREIHRRADVFPDPMRFDPDRFLPPGPGAGAYAPLGASRISCHGEGISIAFGRLLALELARAYTIKVLADGPDEMGPFHWQPNDRWRVRLTPR